MGGGVTNGLAPDDDASRKVNAFRRDATRDELSQICGKCDMQRFMGRQTSRINRVTVRTVTNVIQARGITVTQTELRKTFRM